MKKLGYIKLVLLQVTIVASILLLIACDNKKSNDSKEAATDRNNSKFDDSNMKEDALFLVNAAEINMDAIQLSQLAQEKGKSMDVRDLGKRMEDAHRKSQHDLISLAQRKMVTLPTTASKNSMDDHKKLNDNSNDDFDESYADMMVKKHKAAIDKYEDAADDTHDADIQNWARASLPKLRTHLNHSEECQMKMNGDYLQTNN